MKRLFSSLFFFTFAVSMCAQSMLVHTVKQGETIEAIAKKYKISVYTIQQANPEAFDYFYEGMTLKIPKTSRNMMANVHEYNTQESADASESMMGKGCIAGEFGFEYFLLGERYSDFNMGTTVSFGYRYYLHNNLFAEGFVGYRGYFTSTDIGYEYDSTTTVHNITLPIHVGGNFPVTNKLRVRPFVGPRIDFPVISKIELMKSKESKDAHQKTGVSLELGLDFQFSDWGVRLNYGHGIGDYKNVKFVSLGASYGF